MIKVFKAEDYQKTKARKKHKKIENGRKIRNHHNRGRPSRIIKLNLHLQRWVRHPDPRQGGENGKFVEIENYFGFPEPVSKQKLIEKGKKQTKKFGVDIVNKEALKISREREEYLVETTEKTYLVKGVILASEIDYQKPDIKGLEKYKGKGISYCVTCDGPLYHDKKVGVLGSGDFASKETIELLEYTDDITIFTNVKKFEVEDKYQKQITEKNIPIIKEKISKAYDNNNFQGLKTENKKTDLEGLFVAMGIGSCIDFARELGIPIEDGEVKTKENFSVGMSRVYAAGDCTGDPRQISAAVGEGAKAAISLMEDLREK